MEPFGVLQWITSAQRSLLTRPGQAPLDLNQIWYKHLETNPKFPETRLYMAGERTRACFLEESF